MKTAVMASWVRSFAVLAVLCGVLGAGSSSSQGNQGPPLNAAMARGLATHIFNSADANADNMLDMGELWSIFAAHDVNKDSRIELGEYVSSMQSGAAGNELAPMRHMAVQMFAVADFNHDRTLSNDDAVAIFAVLDKNRDGIIAKDEFIPRWSAVMMRLAQTQ